MRLQITLPGKPYPQPRVRFAKFGAYHSKEHRERVKVTADYLKESATLQGWEKTMGPVRVTIITVSPCPQKLRRQVGATGKRLYKPTRPDIDNYAKYILDCCSRADNIWKDDSTVVELVQKDFYGKFEEEPYTQVTIETIDKYGDV